MIVQIPPYDALAVANQFLRLAERDGKSLDLQKLQKLLYLAHGWYLHQYNTPLLKEGIQFGKFGPYVANVHEAFRRFGNLPINTLAMRMAFDPARGGVIWAPYNLSFKSPDEAYLEEVWQIYKNASGLALAAATSDDLSAWRRVKQFAQDQVGFDIPNEMIKQEMDERVRADQTQTA